MDIGLFKSAVSLCTRTNGLCSTRTNGLCRGLFSSLFSQIHVYFHEYTSLFRFSISLCTNLKSAWRSSFYISFLESKSLVRCSVLLRTKVSAKLSVRVSFHKYGSDFMNTRLFLHAVSRCARTRGLWGGLVSMSLFTNVILFSWM